MAITNRRNNRFDKRLAAAQAQRERVRSNLEGLEAQRKAHLEEVAKAEKALAETLEALQKEIKNSDQRAGLVRMAQQRAAELSEIRDDYSQWAASAVHAYQHQFAVQQANLSGRVAGLQKTNPVLQQGRIARTVQNAIELTQSVHVQSAVKPVDALLAKMPKAGQKKPAATTAKPPVSKRVQQWASNLVSKVYVTESAAKESLKTLKAGLQQEGLKLRNDDAILAGTLVTLKEEFTRADTALKAVETTVPSHPLTQAPAAPLARKLSHKMSPVIATAKKWGGSSLQATAYGIATSAAWLATKGHEAQRAAHRAAVKRQKAKANGRHDASSHAPEVAPAQRAEPSFTAAFPPTPEVAPTTEAPTRGMSRAPEAAATVANEAIINQARSIILGNREHTEMFVLNQLKLENLGLTETQLKGIARNVVDAAYFYAGKSKADDAQAALREAMNAGYDFILTYTREEMAKAEAARSIEGGRDITHGHSFTPHVEETTRAQMRHQTRPNRLMDRIQDIAPDAQHLDTPDQLPSDEYPGLPKELPRIFRQKPTPAVPAATQADTSLSIPHDEKPRVFRTKPAANIKRGMGMPSKILAITSLYGVLGGAAAYLKKPEFFHDLMRHTSSESGTTTKAAVMPTLTGIGEAATRQANPAAHAIASRFDETTQQEDRATYQTGSDEAAYEELSMELEKEEAQRTAQKSVERFAEEQGRRYLKNDITKRIKFNDNPAKEKPAEGERYVPVFETGPYKLEGTFGKGGFSFNANDKNDKDKGGRG